MGSTTTEAVAAEQEVRHHVAEGVAWIELNRPDVGNALTPAGRLRIISLLDDAAERLDVRAVVLAASGRAFCTGADLRASWERPLRPDGAPDRVAGEVARGIRTNAQQLVATIMDCEKPVVAAVNGVAAGMGAHVALACDLVIAAETSRFIEVFVRRGLVPDAGGAYLLSRMLGPHRAKELMFFGDDLSAAAAHELGLVNRVVADDDLRDVVGEWAARLAAGPTRALSLSKSLVNRALDQSRSEAFAAEAMAQDMNMTTADAREGIAAFVERRDARFQGW